MPELILELIRARFHPAYNKFIDLFLKILYTLVQIADRLICIHKHELLLVSIYPMSYVYCVKTTIFYSAYGAPDMTLIYIYIEIVILIFVGQGHKI